MANKMETIDHLKRKLLEAAISKHCLKCDEQTRIERIFAILSQLEDYSVKADRTKGTFTIVKVPAPPNQTFVDKAFIAEHLSKKKHEEISNS